MAFPKNAKKYNNNVAFPTGRLWRAHCVNNSEGRKIVKAHKGLKPLVISINNSDNLSRSNSSFVINNFNLIKEDIRMKNITKILITILSLTLLFVVGCGDRPTGSIPGKETLLSIPFLRLKVTSYLIILTTLIR